MRIFIAGATGVIGRRVVRRLAAKHDVTANARTRRKREQLSRFGATAVQVDLFDAAQVQRAVAGHDVIINLATHIPRSSRALIPGAWRENDRLRRIASANLVHAAMATNSAQRYVQESFAPIYPDCGSEWIDERTPVQAARYNRSVLDAEGAAQHFTESGRTGVVLRFAFFYGPDSDFTCDYIRYIRRGWAPALGSPDGYISSVSHDDAASAVIAALGVPAGVYNVVDDEPLPRREFFGSLAAAVGAPPPRFLPPWVARVMGSLGETLGRSQRISNRKLREISGWKPATPSVREGWRSVLRDLDGTATGRLLTDRQAV